MNNVKTKMSSKAKSGPDQNGTDHAKQKGEQKSIFWKMGAPIREWRNLPEEIRALAEKSARNITLLYEMMIDYRLSLMKTVYPNEKINQSIWNDFYRIRRDHEHTNEINLKKARFFSGLKNLRSLRHEWQTIIAREGVLLDLIIRAPASLKFYNFKRGYEELRKQEKLNEEYNERRFKESYNAIEMALGYVQDYINKREGPSQVLNFSEAMQAWTDKMHEMADLQKSGRLAIDELLKRMETLKNGIFEAPPMAKWITAVEERFTRLIKDHNLLEKNYHKSIIHGAEMEDMKGILNEVVPRMWINGESEPLDRYLKQVETFISAHEPALQEELAYQERHRPWSSNSDAIKDADEIDMLTSFIQIMINAIEARESHMGDHSATVARLARLTAEELQWSEQEIKYLQIAGLMHDVGKIWIPDTLLTKVGPLTDNEIQVLRMHPYYSAKIVTSIKALKDIVPWVYNHHERWDGKGYPDGLRQNEIPLGASIIAVAEAFSSMIFNRLSREPLSFDQAINEVRAGSGKQFDPDVTEQFITAATKIRGELEERQQKGFSSLLI